MYEPDILKCKKADFGEDGQAHNTDAPSKMIPDDGRFSQPSGMLATRKTPRYIIYF